MINLSAIATLTVLATERTVFAAEVKSMEFDTVSPDVEGELSDVFVGAPTDRVVMGGPIDGGYSRVWKAVHVGKKGNPYVAIKTFRDVFLDAEIMTDIPITILTELRLSRAFKHPNLMRLNHAWVPKYYSADGGGGYDVYMEMENFDSDLQGLMNSSPKIVLQNLSHFMYELLKGIKYMHSAGIVHLDIKPSNVFVRSRDLSVVLGDYSLAYQVKVGAPTEAGLGTRGYMAPEIEGVHRDVQQPSYPADMWSVGAILLDILTFWENDLDHDWSGFEESYANHTTEQYLKKTFFERENFDPVILHLLAGLLDPEPLRRLTVDKALADPFFSRVRKVAHEGIYDGPEIDLRFQKTGAASAAEWQSLIERECDIKEIPRAKPAVEPDSERIVPGVPYMPGLDEPPASASGFRWHSLWDEILPGAHHQILP